MKYFSVVLMIMGLLLSSLAFADLSSEITALSTQIVGSELTGVAGSMLKNERVNMYLKDGESTKVFSLVTEKRKVISLAEGELTDPSLKVFSDLDTVMALKNSATPADDLKKALDEGKITYEAVGFWNKIKFGFSNFFMKIFSPKESKEAKEEAKEEVKEEKKEEQEQKKEEIEQKVEEKKEEQEQKKEEIEQKVEEKKEEQEQKKEEIEQKVEEKKEEQEQKKEEIEQKVEEKKEEVKAELPAKNETLEEPESEVEEEPELEGETHTVLLENNGFNPATLTIKVGDTVKWKVSRTGNFKNGMILGTQNCVEVKSKILNNEEEFEWQFKEAGTCTFVDGIITTQISKVIVE